MRILSLIVVLISLLFAFQNCGGAKFSKSESDSKQTQTEGGDGQVFDGKIRILHHIVDNFTCEGRLSPESILYRDSNDKWNLIQNAAEKCAILEKPIASGVVYNEATNTAQFEGKLYVPPKPYNVSASEDPNLVDLNLLDGVCADVNGTCSLKAAVMQASMTAQTEEVIVNIPSGKYDLTSVMPVQLSSADAHKITIKGVSNQTTILDGSGETPHFSIRSLSAAPVSIENLTLQNGWNRLGLYGASIQITGEGSDFDPLLANANISLKNCIFKNNKNGWSVIYVSTSAGSLQISKTDFLDNGINAVQSDQAGDVLIEDSSFLRNAGRGLATNNNRNSVVVKNSLFKQNYEGINVIDCKGCVFDTVTSTENNINGLSIQTSSYDSRYDITFNNSNLKNNAVVDFPMNYIFGNLSLSFKDARNVVRMNSSSLSMPATSTKPNCFGANSYFQNIIGLGSTFSDSSCQVSEK